jgi:alkaline phosphatase D
MEKIQGGWIDLDKYAPMDGLITTSEFLYAPTEQAANATYQKLKAADAAFMVYRRSNVPAELHFNSNAREGDPIIVARGPYAIRAAAPEDREDKAPMAGNHGFDPYMMPNMKAIFYAEGPDIRKGVVLKPFENVNVYPFLAEILGLDAPATDGSASVLEPALAAAR